MEAEFDNFLVKVEEIGSIIQGLASKDRKEVEKASRKADIYLSTADESKITITDEGVVKANRTVINKKACSNTNDVAMQQETMSPDAFMSYMEKDIKQRTEDKRQRKQMSDHYKIQGNEAFRKQDYEKALERYNKAIEEIKDSCVLYTNRALTCLKLGLNLRALEDCTWAHKLNEHNLKAWLYQAQAYHNLGQLDDAERSVEEAIARHPGQKDFIQDYISEWESK